MAVVWEHDDEPLSSQDLTKKIRQKHMNAMKVCNILIKKVCLISALGGHHLTSFAPSSGASQRCRAEESGFSTPRSPRSPRSDPVRELKWDRSATRHW